MHPNPSYHSDDRALMETLLDEIGFGTVFLTTPDGPRVAHTPLVSTGDGAVQFHIARANALARHLDGATALAVINGPDAYVSPRWYTNRKTVPTWDYISLELEGRVRQMDDDGLEALLHTLIERGETRLGGDQWTAQETPPDIWAKLFGAIRGFELEILAWRPTLKLHQGTTAEDRATIAAGLENSGSPALAQLMRTLAV